MRVVAVDLFCGIGGLTKGLTLAGIDVVAGIDIDKSCAFVYEANNNSKFICGDVSKFDQKTLHDLYPSDSIKILVGCAPCQPFSKYSSKYRKDGHKDDKWKLLSSFGNLIKSELPDIVSMENVPNLEKEKIFEQFVSALKDNKYKVDYKVVNCKNYGVPQNRRRLVLLASRLGDIKLIDAVYSDENVITVKQAIYELPKIKAGEICQKDVMHQSSSLSTLNLKRIKQSKQGGTWRDWDEDLRLACHKKDSGKTYPSVYGRMSWDKPSPTITTQFYGYGNGRFGHPEQDRAISLREGAILQSFPADYIFADKDHPINRHDTAIHIGNAVPVELGKAIGISIINHLKNLGG